MKILSRSFLVMPTLIVWISLIVLPTHSVWRIEVSLLLWPSSLAAETTSMKIRALTSDKMVLIERPPSDRDNHADEKAADYHIIELVIELSGTVYLLRQRVNGRR